MAIFTHDDVRHHRVRLEVPCEGYPALLENVYERFTVRVHRIFGIPFWVTEHDVERRPIHELIHQAFGTGGSIREQFEQECG